MRLFNTFVLCAALLLATQGFAQTDKAASSIKTTSKTAKLQTSASQEVKTFGLQVVRNYIEGKMKDNYDLLANEIRSIENGQVFQKSPQIEQAFLNDSPMRTDIKTSYQLYIDNYTQSVMSQKEIEAKYPGISDKLNLQAGDYLFNGATPKDAGSTRIFRASDSARFIVRKIDGNWRIIAL